MLYLHPKMLYYNKCVLLQSCDWTPDHTIQQHIPDDSTFTVTAMGTPHLTHTILIVYSITDFLNKAAFLIF